MQGRVYQYCILTYQAYHKTALQYLCDLIMTYSNAHNLISSKIYVTNTPFCVVFLLVLVLQSSLTEIPLKWPALRNNKSPPVGQARTVVEGYYATNLPHALLTPGRRRTLRTA